MARKGENIYKRKDGRWEGRYIRGRKLNGTIHYGYVYGKTYTAVKERVLPLKIQYLQTQQMNGTFSGSASAWFTYWLQTEVKPQVKTATFANYQYKIQRYVFPYIQHSPLNELEQQHIQGMVDAWQKEWHLAASTIHVVFQILKKGLTSAYNKGYLSKNLCLEVVLPREKQKQVPSLNRTEQQLLESCARKEQTGLPVLLALHTGMRLGEIAALKWTDIDFEQRILTVSQTYQRLPLATETSRTRLHLGEAKTRASHRVIPLSNYLITQLKNHSEKQGGKFIFEKKNRPIEPRVLSYQFKKIAQKAGLATIHFHQLRHTFARRCLEAKADIASVSAILGHHSIKTTLDVYIDSFLEQRRTLMEAMEHSLAI